MKKVYLVLAVIGAIVPYLFYFDFIQVEGLSISLFLRSLFVNGAAGGFSADVLLSTVVFWVFIFHQLRKPNNPKPHLFVFLSLNGWLELCFTCLPICMGT